MELELPKNWREKLLALEVDGAPEPVDNKQTVYTAIRVNFTESKDPDLNTRKFTIRTPGDVDKPYVWRIA